MGRKTLFLYGVTKLFYFNFSNSSTDCIACISKYFILFNTPNRHVLIVPPLWYEIEKVPANPTRVFMHTH